MEINGEEFTLSPTCSTMSAAPVALWIWGIGPGLKLPHKNPGSSRNGKDSISIVYAVLVSDCWEWRCYMLGMSIIIGVSVEICTPPFTEENISALGKVFHNGASGFYTSFPSPYLLL